MVEDDRDRGVGLTPHPHLECRGSRKSRAIPLLTLRVKAYLPKHLERNTESVCTHVFLHIIRPTSHSISDITDKCVFHCLDCAGNERGRVTIY